MRERPTTYKSPHPPPQDLITLLTSQPMKYSTTRRMAQNQQSHQQPSYTLILRLPFPRPTSSNFSTTPPQPTSPTTKPPTQPHLQPSSPAPARSEDTPSMGSSFSDLSGASVAQSALEEALMSDLRADGGGLGSRVSTTGFEGRR